MQEESAVDGRFKVERVLSVPGHGAVAEGQIVEGFVRVGMLSQPLSWSDSTIRLTVSAVEFVDYVSERRANIGLLFQEQLDAEELERRLPDDRILRLTDNGEGSEWGRMRDDS